MSGILSVSDRAEHRMWGRADYSVWQRAWDRVRNRVYWRVWDRVVDRVEDRAFEGMNK